MDSCDRSSASSPPPLGGGGATAPTSGCDTLTSSSLAVGALAAAGEAPTNTRRPAFSFPSLPASGLSSTAFAASSHDAEFTASASRSLPAPIRRPDPITHYGAAAGSSTSAFHSFERSLPDPIIDYGAAAGSSTSAFYSFQPGMPGPHPVAPPPRSGSFADLRFPQSDDYHRPFAFAAPSSSFLGFQSRIRSTGGGALPEPGHSPTMVFLGSGSDPQGPNRPPPLATAGDHLLQPLATSTRANPLYGPIVDKSFKKKLCQFWMSGSCRDGGTCRFAHGHEELSFKKKLCKFWMSGSCRDGGTCRFAHGHEELVKCQAYKTLMCPQWQNGICSYGVRCSFAHGIEEQKPLPPCKFFARGEPCPRQRCGYRHAN